jgi:UDP-glucose 4-epimerase
MRAYNIGGGQGSSVREVIAMVERVGGHAVPLMEGGRRPGDPPVLLADVGKAARELDWQPRLSTLEAIVKSAWSWHARHPVGT